MDDAAAPAVGKLEGVIVVRLARVERNAHEPRLGERVIGDQAVDAVRQQHAHPIAGHEAARKQRIAEPIGEGVELAES